MTGLALGTLAIPILVGLVGPQDAFIAAGCFLPLIAVASYGALRRLDAGAAVPLDVLALLTGVPFLAVLAPRLVERMARDAIAEQRPRGEILPSAGPRRHQVLRRRIGPGLGEPRRVSDPPGRAGQLVR